jgi:L-fuconolactonase
MIHMKIDAEVHFWKYDKTTSNIHNNKILHQHYLPEQLAQSLHRNDINGCVAVVAEKKEVETRFLAELSLTHPEIRGIVGWTNLHDQKSADKIQELHEYSYLKGFQIDAIDESLPSAGVMEKLKEYDFTLDMVIREGIDLELWGGFIHSFPGQPFILQNCGNPDTSGMPKKEWESFIRQLANNQNLNCKISGLLTGGADLKSWKPADFYPFLDILFESFGPERLMFASDWPFILMAGIYVQWKSLMEKFTEKFSTDDRNKFFGENAARIYRL